MYLLLLCWDICVEIRAPLWVWLSPSLSCGFLEWHWGLPCLCGVVVWMRMAPIDSYVWTLGLQLIGRCDFVGGSRSLLAYLKFQKTFWVSISCLLFVDQDVISQLCLLPCLCSTILDSNPMKPSKQLNPFFYKSWYFVRAIESQDTWQVPLPA